MVLEQLNLYLPEANKHFNLNGKIIVYSSDSSKTELEVAPENCMCSGVLKEINALGNYDKQSLHDHWSSLLGEIPIFIDNQHNRLYLFKDENGKVFLRYSNDGGETAVPENDESEPIPVEAKGVCLMFLLSDVKYAVANLKGKIDDGLFKLLKISDPNLLRVHYISR
ncbi:hypothetical protein COEREDRAFT_89643 [Coemansia reversa NRRL 1564]|uniref:Uncharacterized protein n=1 Tax=Coemansia reversa (strain ATCC 12441 / NRRL 1564) TaxID=763665 RepID=A0A2G5B2Y7_COERN|nr:hypothetical protein COEREDRAFT_89643 [Coemansia reversa NRRL 1564]|eukprot:PIA13364.1 hypothetical protein COEREDRAFT_89643 [Coemansia reversa NRRL 1564]